MRTWLLGVLVVASTVMLVACSASSPGVVGSGLVPSVTPTPTPSSTPTPTLPPSPSASLEPAVSTFALVCKPPTQKVLTALKELNGNQYDIPSSWVSMVDIGTGLLPQSDWWMVADRSGAINGSQPTPNVTTFYVAWVTDVPSGGNQWISVFPSNNPSTEWSNLDWTGARLDRAKKARNIAIGCIKG